MASSVIKENTPNYLLKLGYGHATYPANSSALEIYNPNPGSTGFKGFVITPAEYRYNVGYAISTNKQICYVYLRDSDGLPPDHAVDVSFVNWAE